MNRDVWTSVVVGHLNGRSRVEGDEGNKGRPTDGGARHRSCRLLQSGSLCGFPEGLHRRRDKKGLTPTLSTNDETVKERDFLFIKLSYKTYIYENISLTLNLNL